MSDADRTPTGDEIPAMCLTCGNVRAYNGHGKFNTALLACALCGKRTKHQLVGVGEDWAEGCLRKEQLDQAPTLARFLFQLEVLAKLGFELVPVSRTRCPNLSSGLGFDPVTNKRFLTFAEEVPLKERMKFVDSHLAALLKDGPKFVSGCYQDDQASVWGYWKYA